MSSSAAATQASDPVVCRIFVEDEEASDFYPYLVEAKVALSRDAAGVCTLRFDSMRDENGRWLIQDSGIFEPWKKIVIQAAFGDTSEEVMRGYIREVRADYPEVMGAARAIVTAQDESVLMDRQHVRKTWSAEDEPLSDGQIAQQIGGAYGLDVQAEDGLNNASLYQDATDIRFLRDRAVANGFELLVREGSILFRPPQLDAELQSTIFVYSGQATNCTTFSVSYDGYLPDRIAVSRAAATGSDTESETLPPDLKQLGKSAADSESMGLNEFVWFMRQPAGHVSEEARSRAQAKANEMSMKIRGEGELDGTRYGRVLRVAEPVGVDGVGETYSGSYYVDAATHLFTREGYRQQFVLLRNATGNDLEAAAPDSLAAVR